ncbi:dienelactone hydrolase family protein, partial [Actinomadura adrarensis]
AGKLDRALADLDVPHEVKEYPEAGHSFLTDSRLPAPMAPVAKIVMGHGKGREAAPEAWERIFGFFDTHVAAKG